MAGTPLSIDHEYVVAYGKNLKFTVLHGLAKNVESYPLQDERGRFASTDLTVGMGRDARPNQFFPITNPRTGKTFEANPERVWRFYPQTMEQVIAGKLIIWPDDYPERKMERPRYKTYFDPETEKPKPVSSWIETTANFKGASGDAEEWGTSVLACGMNQEGGKVLQDIFGTKGFAYPKPVSLLASLIRVATKGDDLILDSFAGSGTTGHAVLSLNGEDEGARRFILVEIEEHIARTITAERVRRVSQGYKNGRGQNIAGLGGGFRFATLGKTLFDETGAIRQDVNFRELAEFVFFHETGSPLPATWKKSPLLGTVDGRAIYLLYNGILADKTPDGGNVLTAATLAALPTHAGSKVIYAAACRLGASRLDREGIRFKQTPYSIRVD